jgi:hypothetical protein
MLKRAVHRISEIGTMALLRIENQPFSSMVAGGTALGLCYSGEQQFENTHTCKTLWVLSHLAKKRSFPGVPHKLDNDSLRLAWERTVARDLSKSEEQIDVMAGAMHIGLSPPPRKSHPLSPTLFVFLSLNSQAKLPK